MTTTSLSSTLEKQFKITARGSTVGREVRGGIVTFLTMAYIIVLNPIILSGVADKDGKFLGGGTVSGAGFSKIAVTTALVAGVITILMGVVRQLPAGARDGSRPQRIRRLFGRVAR